MHGENAQDPGEREEDLPEGQEEEQCWGSRSGSAGSQDPHVFWPPGSRSMSQRYGSGSSSGSGGFPFSFKSVERIEIILAK